MYAIIPPLGAVTEHPFLFAQGNRFAHLSHRFRDNAPAPDAFIFLGILASVVLLGLAVWSFNRWYAHCEDRPQNNSRRLFRDLCRVHRLERTDRKLLREMAEWHGLSDPVQLFLEPQRLQSRDMRVALVCAIEAERLHAQLFAKSADECRT